MSKMLQAVLVILLLVVAVFQALLFFNGTIPARGDQLAYGSQMLFAGNPADADFQSEVLSQFESLNKRLSRIEQNVGEVSENNRKATSLTDSSGIRVSDSPAAVSPKSDTQFDRLNDRLVQLEKRTETLGEMDKKLTLLANNLGTRSSETSSSSNLQTEIEKRFNRIDDRLSQIENILKH